MPPDSKSPKELLKEVAKNDFSLKYGTEEGLEIRKITMKQDHKDETLGVQKLSLGIPSNRTSKVILLVGATGTGKTTLINAMVNFIFGVNFTDPFRFILIDDKNAPKKSQAESQTDIITAYVFHHMDGMPFEYDYVLIDTPGFGDTRGIERDRRMMKQLENFLGQSYGIDSVDGVGFVTPSSAARLTMTQRYVYEGLSSMFGKDIKKNIYIMATFADAKKPPVLEALKVADVQYEGFYKFNNSALYADNKGAELSDGDSDSDGEADSAYICKLFWEMGYKSMNNFFIKLGKTSPASLTLTKEVLSQRTKLQLVVVSLQKQIGIGLNDLANLQKELSMLDSYNADMKGSENYEEEVEVPKIEQIDLNSREYTTNCLKCNMTCHYPCAYSDDADKINCAAMTKGEYCGVCPENCYWDIHKNMSYRFETTWTMEKRTVQELMQRYNQAKDDKCNKEQAVKAIEDEINKSASGLISMIKESQQYVERLEEIALKPNPLSTTEYIELMIESEKLQKRHNFEKRIKLLEHLKEEVNLLKGIGSNIDTSKSGVRLLEQFKAMIGRS